MRRTATSAVALIACLSLCLAGCGAAGESGYPLEVAAYDFTVKSEYSTQGLEQVSYTAEDIDEVYTFTMAGGEYALPCPVTAFTEAGWTPQYPERTVVPGFNASNPTNIFYLNGDENVKVYLDLLNPGDEEASWKRCTVVGVTVEYGTAPAFETSAGIALGSSIDDVEAAYGGSDYEVDRYGTIGYHFLARLGDEYAGHRWYGESSDTLTFMVDTTLHPGWEDDHIVAHIHLQSFSGIDASEEADAATEETEPQGEVVTLH